MIKSQAKRGGVKSTILVVVIFPLLFAASSFGTEITIGPILQLPGSDTMSVYWETDTEATGGIFFEDTNGNRFYILKDKKETRHVFTMSELVPGMVYEYAILVDGKTTYESWFTTLKESGEYRIAIIGDTHTPKEPFSEMAPLIDEYDPTFLVHLGDIVNEGGNIDEWLSFFEMGSLLFDHIPVIPVIGDHDCNNDDYDKYYGRFFLMPGVGVGEDKEIKYYYSAKFYNDLYIVLDVETERPLISEGRWFKGVLRGAKDVPIPRHIFVLSHEGVISFKGNRRGYAGLKPYLGLMGSAGVSILFSGHDHHYVKGRTYAGPYFFVSGGGGGALYDINEKNPFAAFVGVMESGEKTHHFLVMDVTDDECVIWAIDNEGGVIDGTVIKKIE